MIVAVTGQKGGVGKSTVAIHLAAEAKARGMRVLLVDADPQATVRTWSSVAAQGGHDRPVVVSMGADLHQPSQLPDLAPGYDLVVIDGPAKLDTVQRAALMVADLALFPCGPSGLDAWALGDTLGVLTEARRLRPTLDAAIVITRSQPRTALGRQVREVMQQTGLNVLRTALSHRIVYQEALSAGQHVSTYAPSSEASREVRNLLDDVLDRLQPPAAAPAKTPASPRVKPAATPASRRKKSAA